MEASGPTSKQIYQALINGKGMKQELYDLLCEHMGKLLHQQENTFDWIAKEQLTRELNAVRLLLGIDYQEESWLTKVKNALK